MEENNYNIEEINTNNFIEKVIEFSKNIPVAVDFWAPWCNPCKQLTPILEKAAHKMNGSIKLVKINIDENQNLAQQMRIQSVPTVLVFFQGKPINGFAGLKDETEAVSFFQEVCSASSHSSDDLKGINDLLDEAEKNLKNNNYEVAENQYGNILAQSLPKKEMIKALVGLGRCYIAQSKFDDMMNLIDQLEDDIRNDKQIQNLLESKKYLENIEPYEITDLKVKLEKTPNDYDIRYDLARGQIANKNYSEAIDNLLFIIEKKKDWEKGKARKEILSVFSLLGNENSLTIRGRSRLSNLIFK